MKKIQNKKLQRIKKFNKNKSHSQNKREKAKIERIQNKFN